MNSVSNFIRLALKYLSRRPRSVSEIKAYLARRLATPDQISAALRYLEKHSLLNDRHFAEWLISSRARQGKSALAISRELQGFGISLPPDQISVDELANATRLVQKLNQRYGRLSPRVRSKIFRYLLAKGFNSETIEQAIRNIYNHDQC